MMYPALIKAQAFEAFFDAIYEGADFSRLDDSPAIRQAIYEDEKRMLGSIFDQAARDDYRTFDLGGRRSRAEYEADSE